MSSEKKEQVKPLAPASLRIDIDEDDALSMELKKNRHRKYVNCCGCITAVMLIQAVVILVLVFTVFRVKNPILRMNSVSVQGLNLALGSNLRPGTNLTVVADVSVKNPNVASFRFNNATTVLYYDGRAVGEARTPEGHARARRTLHMNVTIVAQVDRILEVPRLGSDLRSGSLPISSFTRITGKVKILKIIKRNVVVKLNCTMTVNINSQTIENQDCKRHVSL